MKTIDLSQWKRREHFEFFYRADHPQYNICANIDVTRFLAYVKENKLSFYYAMIYAVTDVANQCENFKYRIRDGKTIVLHDRLIPSYTDIEPNSTDDLFKLITIDLDDNLVDFVGKAREAVINQKEYFVFERFAGHDEFLFITCIPWISFTHVSHTISLNRNDAVPRISWGKYFSEGEKTLLPFSVQVHHAFIDGVHMGDYFEKLQKYLNKF